MKRTLFPRTVATVLVVIMLASALPVSAFAAIANWTENNVVFDGTTFGTNGYYNVISKKDYTLVPSAAIESEMVINNSTGTRRQVMHIIELDPSNPDVSILPGYYGIDTDWATNVSNQKAAGVSDVAAYYEDVLGYNVVGAMNTALSYDCNAPYSWLVYNGEVLVDAKNGINNFHSGTCATMLCVYKNAETGECSVELRTAAQGLRGDEWQAIGANFGMVVNNGELVSKTEERTSSPAARSLVGVKEDGTLVLVMNDGRGANNSVGFNNYELGESMLSLGCKWAFNCDGGGSSSFVTKRAGEDELTIRCVPCDGAERPTLNSVIIASNVGKTGILDAVNITSDYDIFAPNTTYTFGVQAVDTHGYAMEMPADATWALSDDSFGTIENGTFVSNGTLGNVTVQVVSGGNVVGEKVIKVANPETLKFTLDSTTLPYGKSTTLAFTSLSGEAEVYLDDSSFDFALDNAGGTLDGLTFTAGNDESITQTVITATYKATNQVLTFTVNFGKGSEFLFDFEDGDISDWKGTDDAYAWLKEHGVETPFGTLIDGGQISLECKTTTFLSTKENGKVHNGNNALGITFNMTQVNFNSWVYGILYNTADSAVLRDVNNGKKATTLGMWMYMPEDFQQTGGKMAFQLQAYVGKDGSGYDANWKTTGTGYSGTSIHFQYKGTNLNALTESQIPENRWIYVTANISGYDYVALIDPLNDYFRSPSFLRTYIKPDVCREITWYIDDITLDYSSAVDDRVPPTISDPQYATADTNIAFTNGVTISTESAAYTAYISDDNSGIDAATAQIYVDGNAVGTKVSGNMMYTEAIALTTGKHLVKFEVTDKLGNITTLTRQIESTYASGTGLVLSGHNDSGETPMPGSVYYIDVVKAGTGSMANGTTVTLSLNTANKWILDQVTAAAGCEVTYTVNPEHSNEVTFTIKTSGNVENGVVFTVPVRVYNPLSKTPDGGIVVSGKSFKAPLTVELLTNSNYDSYSIAAFEAARKIDRHEHTAVELPDKEAELGVAGYTGRTYCDVCKSVVDFGTTIPALVHTHSYELVDGKFVCSDPDCGDVYDAGTGIFEMNGKVYYAIAGNLVKGWQNIDEEWYYFNNTYAGQEGSMKYGSNTYSFVGGKLVSGLWVTDGNGTRYFYGPDYYRCTGANKYANVKWVEINGKTYAFDREGYIHTGISMINESNNPGELYEFTDDGALVGKYITTVSGPFKLSNGLLCYLNNGTPVAKGLFQYRGSYYYINSSYVSVTGTYNCTNQMTPEIPAGVYEFDETGKMINPPGVKNGIVEENGNLYFYENGQRVKKGLVEVEDGVYYYFSMSYKALQNGSYYLPAEMMNGLLPAGTYLFEDYKLVIKNGVYEENGNKYYYVNNERVQKGLVEVEEGVYNYFGLNYKALKDGTYYLPEEKMNGLLPAGTYLFDGYNLVIKNGVYEENGNKYYYENNERVKKGLVEVEDGVYYYFSMSYKALKDGTYYLPAEMMNGLLPAGTYLFDGYNLVIKNGVYEENGNKYYYENNERVKKGLVEVEDGVYYYFSMSYKALQNGSYYLPAEMMNGLLPAGTYLFEDYKLVIKNGVYEENGNKYYYENNERVKKGLVEVEDGVYYYFSMNYKALKDGTYYLPEEMMNGILPAGYYMIGNDYKVIIKNGVYEENGNKYYYENNVKVKKGLVEVEEGVYYYFSYSYKALKDGTYYLPEEMMNGIFPAGNYTFENYKFIVKDGFVRENGGIYYYKDCVLQKDLGVIVVDGNYYYVRANGALATGNYRIDYGTNGYLRGGYHTFDENGVLQVDPSFVVGVRGARDIAYLNQTSDVKIKEGLLIRGSELDCAVWDIVTEEEAAYGVNVLKNQYGIKMDMDLRVQTETSKDAFGESILHKYYDMVYYDQVFTEEGKEKIRAVFTDLANEANYPIYMHCTYGLDRTGTVCYLLEALLGFNDWNLSHDYCSTLNSHEPSILKIKTGLQDYAGTTRQEQVTAYLLSCGLTQEQLNTICEIFLAD